MPCHTLVENIQDNPPLSGLPVGCVEPVVTAAPPLPLFPKRVEVV